MSLYYRADYNGKQVLVCCEQDEFETDGPLTWTDPEKDHRPLFVLTNHTRYTFGDKDAEDTAWRLLRASTKWRESWDEGYLYDGDDYRYDKNGYRMGNPDYLDPDDGISAIVKAAERTGAHVMPVYMYDHSGVRLSLGRDYPFNCPWDSGCLGVILWTREQQDAFCAGEILWGQDAGRVMESFFKEYKQFVEGEVYILSVIDPTAELEYLDSRQNLPKGTHTLADLDKRDLEFCASGNVLDSCGSFYFDDACTPILVAQEHFGVANMTEL